MYNPFRNTVETHKNLKALHFIYFLLIDVINKIQNFDV